MRVDPKGHADPRTRETTRAAVADALRLRWPAAIVVLSDTDADIFADFEAVPGLGDVECSVHCGHASGDTRDPLHLRDVSWHARAAGYLPGWGGGADASLPGGRTNASGEHPDDPCEAVALALRTLADALASASAGVRALAESQPAEPTP